MRGAGVHRVQGGDSTQSEKAGDSKMSEKAAKKGKKSR